MESSKPVSFKQDDEILLKDLILRLQEWIKYLWGKWLVILITGIVFAGLGVVYALTKKPQYTAELTFILEDSKSSPLGAYTGLASQFGIDIGGNAGSSVFSGDNIMEFLKLRLMVQKTLLTPVLSIKNGHPQSLADQYIDMINMREQWKDNPQLSKLSFSVSVDRLSFQHDSILGILYNSIIKNNLSVTKPDKKLSFISVECKSENESFSKAFTETLVKEATDFYIQTKIHRSKTTVDKLQAKADSIVSLLNRSTFSVAASQDMNLNPARSMAGVRTELAARDKIILQTMYGEVIKNLELSKMAMAQETPIIQVVDTPILPLKKEKLGKVKAFVIGGFLGVFLISVWLLLRRIYHKIMEI